MAAGFPTTSWTIVLAARGASVDGKQKALAHLCQNYWSPLYFFARRRGHSVEDAQDLTQAFFVRVLDKSYFDQADRKRGRFRNFLLASFTHFLANEWDRAQAVKRGGGVIRIALDGDSAEEQYRREPVDRLTPEKIFERNWAHTVLDRSMTSLEQEYGSGGKREVFRAMRGFLTGDISPRGGYESVAAQLGMTAGALKVAVHRARRRFGELLWAEVAETVERPDQVQEEIRHLLAALD